LKCEEIKTSYVFIAKAVGFSDQED